MNNIDLERLGLRRGARILDLGCARGDQSILLAQRGYEVVGADVDTALLEIFETRAAEQGVPVTAWRLDARQGVPEAGSFDAVVCTEVLEHVPDYRRAVDEIARALKPGGRACIAVPTARTELVFQRLHPQYVPLSTHVNVLPRPLLLAELRRAGLVVEHTESRNFEWTLFWLLHCLARSRFDHTGTPLEHQGLTRFYHRLRGTLRKLRLDGLVMRIGDRLLPKSLYVYALRPADARSTVRSSQADDLQSGEAVENGVVKT